MTATPSPVYSGAATRGRSGCPFHEYDDMSQFEEGYTPTHWGGFITTGFRPVFSTTGFIALFLQLLENGSKNFRSRVFGQFLVPGFSALFVYNVITQKEQ